MTEEFTGQESDTSHGESDTEYYYKFNCFRQYYKFGEIRIALELTGKAWKNNTVDKHVWPKYKKTTPNGYLPTLQEEGKEHVKDQSLAILRYICMKHGMYPTNPLDRYKAERLVDLITSDCQLYTPEFLEAEDQEEWIAKRAKEVLPEFLRKINKNIDTNYMKHGWAATKELSIADVALLTWLSSVIFNPYFETERSQLLSKFNNLSLYWDDKKQYINDYIKREG